MTVIPTSPEVQDQIRELQQQIVDSRAEVARLTGGGGEQTLTERGTFIVDDVPAFVHCSDPFCKGMESQRETVAQREQWVQTYGSRGGGEPYANHVENIAERLFFKDPSEYICPDCHKDSLEISRQVRPKYRRLSGHDPEKLLTQIRAGITSESVVEAARKKAAEGGGDSAELKELRAQLAEQRAMLSLVLGQQAGSPVTLTDEQTDALGITEPEPEPAEDRRGILDLGPGRVKALWRDVDGKQRSKTCETVEDAFAVREQRLAEAAELKRQREA